MRTRLFHSLTARFVVTLLIATAVPFVLFGIFAQRGMRGRLKQSVVSVYLPELAAAAAAEIDARLAQVANRGASLSVSAREMRRGGGLDLFRNLLDFTPGVNDDFDVVLLLDPDGTLVHARQSPRLDPITMAARERLLRDVGAELKDTDWFRMLSSGETAEIWIDRHLSPLLHATTTETQVLDPDAYSLGLAYAVPMQKEPSTPGALYVLVRWKQVQDVLDDRQTFLREQAGFASAEALLVRGEDGMVLASTDRSQYTLPLQPQELRTAVLASERGTVEFGDRVAGYARLLGRRDFPWWVVLHARQDEVYKVSADFGRVLAIAIGGIVLAMLVVSRYLSRPVLRPVHELAQATRRVARGDLTARVPARGPREIAELGRAFNTMAHELHASREQLREAERQAAWAEMARQIAHEIKNPLTPMRMSAQMVQKALAQNDPRLHEVVGRLARTVLDQTDALARIASDFRQFAGAPKRQVERVRAELLLDDVHAQYAGVIAAGETSLEVVRGAGTAEVDADRQELRRVFLNLIDNAIEAGGKRVRLGSAREDGQIAFRVEDDGPGVSAEARARLFEPYFTTKSAGTGLGLAICRKIVLAHGGTITLEASARGRTVFRIGLPIAGEAPAEPIG